MSAALESTKVLNGAFGKLHHEGEWLSHVYGLEVNIDANYEQVKKSGRRVIGHKLTTIEMNGSIQEYKVTNKLIEAIGQIKDHEQGSFVTELLAEMHDPDNPEMSNFYRLIGVQFQNIPGIGGYQHGELVEQELQFVFEDYEILGSPTTPAS